MSSKTIPETCGPEIHQILKAYNPSADSASYNHAFQLIGDLVQQAFDEGKDVGAAVRTN